MENIPDLEEFIKSNNELFFEGFLLERINIKLNLVKMDNSNLYYVLVYPIYNGKFILFYKCRDVYRYYDNLVTFEGLTYIFRKHYNYVALELL